MTTIMSATDIAPAVVLESLVKTYGDRTVLNRLQCSIEQETVVGVLGPNGAGKSTLLEIVAGLRKVTEGSVKVLGLNPSEERRLMTRLVSIQPQTANVFGALTVRETLRLHASFHADPCDVFEMIAKIGLNAQEDSRVENLSGGQRRRLLFGVAIIGKPKLVILDEPSAGLDPEAKLQLVALIKELGESGTTVLVSTHDMSEAAQACDRVVILVNGQIKADGSPKSLIESAKTHSKLLFEVATRQALTKVYELFGANSVSAKNVGESWSVQVESADPDGLLQSLVRDSQVRGRKFRIETPSLEDFYLSIVQDLPAGDNAKEDHG
ncbi:ABC transporter ATP-binding protein [Leucobacter sp. cx-42]|uniref:ABC transporter ATP-binding protein n=1 Tax=unclassified Leucobacter TaxID=2621730 RepID=UPI00165D9631|nr:MULTISPECIES: ABC transporter ATP-binding protein [unclassified Leucobacter]MBC9954086.1 ABC transporter ATP-binding protein [Leucobacter sp. cx-42]